MKKINVAILLLTVCTLVGCGMPKPTKYIMPPANAVTSHTEKLPFRIAAVSVHLAPPKNQATEEMLHLYKDLEGVEKLIHNSLYDSVFVNKHVDEVISVDIAIRSLTVGANTSREYSPSKFSAEFTVTDPISGALLFQKTYSKSRYAERATSFKDYGPIFTNQRENLFQIVNEVLNEFVGQIYSIKTRTFEAQSADVLDGTLELVLTEYPGISQKKIPTSRVGYGFTSTEVANPKVLIYVQNYKKTLKSELSKQVTKACLQEKIFSQSNTHKYLIKIFVPRITGGPSSIWSEATYGYYGDAVIYKNGVEIANVEIDPSEYEKSTPLPEIVGIHTAKIIKKLKSLKSVAK